MDLKEIRQLVKLVENAGIGELEIEEDGKKIKITKNSKHTSEQVVMSNPQMLSYQQPATSPASHSDIANIGSATETVSSVEEESAKYYEVHSPMVGTFYRAPSPDSDPYVEVGQQIGTGQTLCIIEAMKLMNELESDYSGKIAKILVENAQPVEYNQVLFLIEK